MPSFNEHAAGPTIVGPAAFIPVVHRSTFDRSGPRKEVRRHPQGRPRRPPEIVPRVEPSVLRHPRKTGLDRSSGASRTRPGTRTCAAEVGDERGPSSHGMHGLDERVRSSTTCSTVQIGGAVERTGLENRRGLRVTVGSNPTLTVLVTSTLAPPDVVFWNSGPPCFKINDC